MKRVTYQYWMSMPDGETYAVKLINGIPKWINGPLYHEEVTSENLPNFNWDDPFDGNTDDYMLINIEDM